MSDKASNNGLGLGVILAIVFTVLKLCNIITWSWVWVLSPIWIPFALVGIILTGAFFLGFIKKVGKE